MMSARNRLAATAAAVFAGATALLLGPAVLLPRAAHAQSRVRSSTTAVRASTVRRELQGRYARFIQAYLNKRTGEARRLMTADFRGGRRGEVNRDEVITSLQRAFGGVGVVRRSRVNIERLRLSNNGRTAVATTRHEFAGDVTDSRDRRRHSLDARLRYRDTWVQTSDGWKLRRSVPLLQNVRVDGRPIPTGGTGGGARRRS